MAKRILVLGVGNYILGDEGIGVHAVRELEKIKLPANVTLLDGGTGGFHLMSYFSEFEKIIMIDATLSSRYEGEIAVLKPKFASDFPRSLSAHDIGLKDMIESITLLDKLPDIILITVSIKHIEGLSVELSPVIKDTIPAIISEVEKLVADINEIKIAD